LFNWTTKRYLASGYDVCVAQSQGSRESQADHYSIDTRDQFIALSLCDGIGSHKYGGQSAALCADYLTKELDFGRSADNGYLPEFSNELNEFLLRRAPSRGKEQFGTTGVALYLGDSAARWLSVGDSSLLCVTGRQVKRLTNAEVANVAVENASGASVERQVLTNGFGKASHFARRNFSFDREPARENDVFIMFSDGFDLISEQQISAIVAAKLSEGVEVLVTALMHLWQQVHQSSQSVDNCTLAVIQMLSD